MHKILKVTSNGYYGDYGGQFLPETLMPNIKAIETAYYRLIKDKSFLMELKLFQEEYIGRPTPLYYADNLTNHYNSAKIYFKRDELNHTGAHKINNCVGQALLAKHMKKKRIIAETGAGQHGVATATICAKLGLECVVYMGEKDANRQSQNVFRMKLLGAKLIIVQSGSKTLKSAMNEAMRDWVSNTEDTYYLIGTAAGPHPFPEMVRNFQSIIGKEAKKQITNKEGKLPQAIIACVGGGSNAIGLFDAFLDNKEVDLYGVEAGGKGTATNQTAAALTAGEPGILHGNKSYFIQDKDGQIKDAYSISAGLDYPGVGPQHAFLKDCKRVIYASATDKEAISAFQLCSKLEGIIPALEPSHALAFLGKIVKRYNKNDIILLNLCGRGDKDIYTVAKALNEKIL
jgi:tryptophan synthase beta chain